jgi:hypothetical protein
MQPLTFNSTSTIRRDAGDRTTEGRAIVFL